MELSARGLSDPKLVEEARGHLADATEDGQRRGLTRDEAEREAIARFGAPDVVAASFGPGRFRVVNRIARALAFRGRFRDVLARRLFTGKGSSERLVLVDKPRHGYRVPQLSEPEARAQLLPVLERFAPRMQAPSGTLVSLTFLEELKDARTCLRRYRATFSNGTSVTCTIVQSTDHGHRGIALEPSSE
jgi:hypothetical protein